ncbi:hypothetical protein NLP61_22810 [Escherichia coli]|jgi:predicted transposase/invertase (TIGR01784 family)|uniref:hypothetical protein n=1 Tax=Escherichia coli TaxID=562 RepID=UPI0013E0E92D|nr:hypothetical protein [Escherichia coli]EHM5182405.1 hypothetical protein [Escherichia coli]EHW2794925.1 hypothetical protein [Escherichia coli]EHW3033793.1 hypothetical protein [Escherichia coli]EHW3354172.1 hypothetical protein [Escherichia coli]EHW4682574.1 hypothetical protein [Escherichia coli]
MRVSQPGKMPGFLSSRSRANSMTLAERLIQKGFEKGALEVAREIACRLRDMGWPPERIQEATGLSGEELKKLFPDEQ